MIYLVTNIYVNKGIVNIEFRDDNLDKVFLKSNVNEHKLNVGNFVLLEKISGKYNIREKISTPENFLDYYPKGKMSYSQLYEEFKKYYDVISNKRYKIILDETVFKNLDFFKYPAAKNIHHAFIGGLAEHTLNILKMSESFIEMYELDKELLFMGIILHDYSKINEMTHFGLNYSAVGNLVGHLVMTVEEIAKISFISDFEDTMDIILLKHLILSHHGRLEYGSPKEPMIKEAYILSQLDEIDAKMDVVNKAYGEVLEGTLTPSILAFDRRRFFKYTGGKGE